MNPTLVTEAGRRAAAALMQDACTITRASAEPGPLDPVTLAYTPPAPEQLYSGPCRVKHAGGQASDRQVESGERQINLWPFTVSVPTTVLDLQPDDLVTITASALDADLVGLVLRVRDVVQGSQVTAHRLGCEVNAG
jgi:hypothetical protein